MYVSSIREIWENSNYKDNGIGWSLLSSADALEKDNKKLNTLNWQLKAKCESQRVSLAA